MTMDIMEELYSKYLKPEPCMEVDVIDRIGVRVYLKREYKYGSRDILWNIKRKPAYYLFHDLYEKGVIKEGMKLISASSGNFVLNLGLKVLEYGFKLISVTPPRIPKENIDALTALGVDVIHITEEFDMCPRETTVFYTRNLAETYRYKLVNVDQYSSWQNVLSHLFLTWNEIKEEFDRLDFILIALGSTGTYMGVSLGNRLEKIVREIIGVQPPHSHSIPGVHHIVDGCEWNPEIYSPSIGGKILTIDDIDTYRWMALLNSMGINVGPSTAMLFAALDKYSSYNDGDYLIISPDSDRLYRNHLIKVYKNLFRDIVSRYPDDEELVRKYVEKLEETEVIDLANYIKKIYNPSESGEVYKISRLDTKTIHRIIMR